MNTEISEYLKAHMIRVDKIPEKCLKCKHCYIGLTMGEDVVNDYARCKDMYGIAYLNYDSGLGSGCEHEVYDLWPFDDMEKADIENCEGYEEGPIHTFCPQWIQRREEEWIKANYKEEPRQENE